MAVEGGHAELSIFAPSGSEVAKFSFDAELSARMVKEQLEAQFGYPTNAQQLVVKQRLLQDDSVLASIWESMPPPYSLVLVILPFCWWDALGHAAKHCRVAAVRELMLGPSNVGMMQAVGEEGEACCRGVADALRVSIEQHQLAAFTEIMAGLAEFPAPQRTAALRQAWQPNNLLHVAIKSGDVGMVEKVLATSMPKGALAMEDNSGFPPLHLAARKGSDDVFRTLLVAVAAEPALLLERVLADSSTALHYLMSKGRHALVKELVAAVDDEGRGTLLLAQQGRGKWTALHLSMAKGHREATRALLAAVSANERSMLLFARNKDGCTPLHTAALQGGEGLVQEISDVVTTQELHQLLTTHDDNCAVPLHLAAAGGHKAVVSELLVASSPHDRPQLFAATNYQGLTPLHIAAAENKPDALRELLAHTTPGAKRALLYAGSFIGGTPLHLASWNGHEATAHVLSEAAAESGEDLTPRSWGACC